MKWHDDLCMARERVSLRASALEDLAEAFSRCGNESVATELMLSAQVLREVADTIHVVSGTLIRMLLHDAQAASRNMLNAALAGISLKAEEP